MTNKNSELFTIFAIKKKKKKKIYTIQAMMLKGYIYTFEAVRKKEGLESEDKPLAQSFRMVRNHLESAHLELYYEDEAIGKHNYKVLLNLCDQVKQIADELTDTHLTHTKRTAKNKELEGLLNSVYRYYNVLLGKYTKTVLQDGERVEVEKEANVKVSKAAINYIIGISHKIKKDKVTGMKKFDIVSEKYMLHNIEDAYFLQFHGLAIPKPGEDKSVEEKMKKRADQLKEKSKSADYGEKVA